MKNIEVVAAVIIEAGKVFATQRGYGDFKDGWEFPGGKIEKGESGEEALKREIREELNTEIEVKSLLGTIEHDYPEFHITMHCYSCKILSGSLELREHEASKWLSSENLMSVSWLPADIAILDRVKSELQ